MVNGELEGTRTPISCKLMHYFQRRYGLKFVSPKVSKNTRADLTSQLPFPARSYFNDAFSIPLQAHDFPYIILCDLPRHE